MSFQENQSDVFLAGEGDRWFDRSLTAADPVRRSTDIALKYLLSQNLDDATVIEVGCAEGWRLHELSKQYRAEYIGVDPSKKATEAGKKLYGPAVDLRVATAANTGLESDSADFLLAGFCLCLCDRGELFQIAYEFDRLLKDGGQLLVLDFVPPIPYQNPYHHRSGLSTFKMDYASMFEWNPDYSMIHMCIDSLESQAGETDSPDTKFGLKVLRKDSSSAYPVSPFT